MRFTLREERLSWTELQGVEDPELIRQLFSGNHDALAVIVDRYQRLVFSVAGTSQFQSHDARNRGPGPLATQLPFWLSRTA